MMSYPWDSLKVSLGEDGRPIYSRPYSAADLQKYQGKLFTNGVFTDEPDSFKVSPGEGLSVLVNIGTCCINGTFGYPEGEADKVQELLLPASEDMDRICTVVLRWDASQEHMGIQLYVVAGAPAEVPVRPALTRTETVYELGLCDIFMPAYSQSVTTERITDTRLDTERCGIVSAFVPLDTQSFFDQLEEQTNVAVELAQSAIDGTALAGKVSKSGDTMTGELNLEVPLGIESGGTGADTEAGARAALQVPGVDVYNVNEIGLLKPDGEEPQWLRTPPKGICPPSVEDAANSVIGTTGGWSYANGYFKRLNINGTQMDGGAVAGKLTYFSVSGSSTASQGTSNVTTTVTLSPSRTEYFVVLRSAYACIPTLSNYSVSGNTLTLTFALRNVTNSTQPPVVNGYVVETFTGLRRTA